MRFQVNASKVSGLVPDIVSVQEMVLIGSYRCGSVVMSLTSSEDAGLIPGLA